MCAMLLPTKAKTAEERRSELADPIYAANHGVQERPPIGYDSDAVISSVQRILRRVEAAAAESGEDLAYLERVGWNVMRFFHDGLEVVVETAAHSEKRGGPALNSATLFAKLGKEIVPYLYPDKTQ